MLPAGKGAQAGSGRCCCTQACPTLLLEVLQRARTTWQAAGAAGSAQHQF